RPVAAASLPRLDGDGQARVRPGVRRCEHRLSRQRADHSLGRLGRRRAVDAHLDRRHGDGRHGGVAGHPRRRGGADARATLAARTGITASPTTAWTTGQYVTLADATAAHWSSSAWVAGI